MWKCRESNQWPHGQWLDTLPLEQWGSPNTSKYKLNTMQLKAIIHKQRRNCISCDSKYYFIMIKSVYSIFCSELSLNHSRHLQFNDAFISCPIWGCIVKMCWQHNNVTSTLRFKISLNPYHMSHSDRFLKHDIMTKYLHVALNYILIWIIHDQKLFTDGLLKRV